VSFHISIIYESHIQIRKHIEHFNIYCREAIVSNSYNLPRLNRTKCVNILHAKVDIKNSSQCQCFLHQQEQGDQDCMFQF
jgi:hypothetical protein